jgi:FkbM family methyltransferase
MLRKANNFTCRVSQRIEPLYSFEIREGGGKYRFFCPNLRTYGRARSLFTKEPETINWINSFSSGDVLFDIGANVGIYSVYAAALGVLVVAFEPESQNYAILNRNIYLNNQQNRIIAYNLALSNEIRFNKLYLSRFEAGSALHNFSEAKDWKHQSFDSQFQQGCISITLDEFIKIADVDFPVHIKIDVDGIESKVVEGAKGIFNNPRLKSVLIELNDELEEDQQLKNLIISYGYKLIEKKHAPKFDNSRFKNVYNNIFVRL